MEIGQKMDIEENMKDFDANPNEKICKTFSSDDPTCGRLVPLPDGEIVLYMCILYIHIYIPIYILESASK
jgi:hypothetical protein